MHKSTCALEKIDSPNFLYEKPKVSNDKKRALFGKKVFINSESTTCSNQPKVTEDPKLRFASPISTSKYAEVDDAFSMSSEGDFVDFNDLLNFKKDDRVHL